MVVEAVVVMERLADDKKQFSWAGSSDFMNDDIRFLVVLEELLEEEDVEYDENWLES